MISEFPKQKYLLYSFRSYWFYEMNNAKSPPNIWRTCIFKKSLQNIKVQEWWGRKGIDKRSPQHLASVSMSVSKWPAQQALGIRLVFFVQPI